MAHSEAQMTEFFQYLDDLRESGATNMYGARPYLEAQFPSLTSSEAGTVLRAWMKSFKRDSPLNRAKEVLAQSA